MTTILGWIATEVNSNPLISNIQKLNYLRSQLHGKVLLVIAGFSLTSADYNYSVVLLKDHYGQPQKLITAHMQTLLGLPNPSNTLSGLQSFCDAVERHAKSVYTTFQIWWNPDRPGVLWIHRMSVYPWCLYNLPLYSTIILLGKTLQPLWFALLMTAAPINQGINQCKFEWLSTQWWSQAQQSLLHHFAIQMPSYWNWYWQWESVPPYLVTWGWQTLEQISMVD